MPRCLGRRKFLSYGAAAAGVSFFLKACTASETPSSPEASTPNQAEALPGGAVDPDAPIKVGLLHSLSGLMAISEIAVVDAALFAIDQINGAGGVLGRPIEAVVADGASDWPTFAEKTERLIAQDQVVALFGGWSAGSRQAMLPVLAASQQLLWCPFPHQEGQGCSQYIIYGGAAPNQQIEPAVDWLLENKGTQFFLLESQAASPELSIKALLSAQLKAKEGELIGSEAFLLSHRDFSDSLTKIKDALPEGGIILNRLEGESHLSFFKQLKAAGMTPDQYPVMSVTLSEAESRQIGPAYLAGHYATWTYFQTLDTEVNKTWVADFKQAYGDGRVTSDPMASAYTLVYLWKQAVEQAGSFDIPSVRAAAYGQTFESPGGAVTLQPNHHLSKSVRVGKVGEDGLFEIVWSTEQPLEPQARSQYLPEPKGPELKGAACDRPDVVNGSDVENGGQ
ncbi:MAG: urea ABC transporter substrate-binding protein [Cyanobacteria bacterium P01_G01_bin.38]